MSNVDRDMLASFLASGSGTGYVPQSQEILGILKQMKDEMEKDLADAKAKEAEAKAAAEGLIAAAKKQIEALTKSIEEKLERIGNAGVELAEMKNDLEDTKEGLEADKKFLADMEKNCELKKKEWAAYKKTQAEELLALAETIKILNDDDALELFKKTLPSAASLLQLQVSGKEVRQRALTALSAGRSMDRRDARLDLLEMALRGKQMGFEKVVKLIDDLIALLKNEQGDDDAKKEYCLAEFDTAEDKVKAVSKDIADLEKAIADDESSIATLKSEIEALEDAIKALDKSVAEATDLRKSEHEEYVEDLTATSAAKDLLGFAKNRLNKFYNPKLYKAPPKRELSEEDQIVVNMGGTLAPTAAPGGIAGTGIGLAQTGVAPPPPPEANLAYKKSGSESNGVIAMIDLLIADIDKDIQTSEVEEKDAPKEYEVFMSDSSEKRALDSKAITDKAAAKAETETQLQADEDTKKSKLFQAMETAKYIGVLHEECDWLLKYFDARQ